MDREEKQFPEKHGSDTIIDTSIKSEIIKRAKTGELPCAVAFEIAKGLGVSTGEVGKTADLINIILSKCQMGLFGYKPEKKKVKPLKSIDQDLKSAIRDALVEGRLPCKSAWDISTRLGVAKMTVSGACEAMDIKIKPCQLGAF